MKKILILVMVVLSIFFLQSCNKEDEYESQDYNVTTNPNLSTRVLTSDVWFYDNELESVGLLGLPKPNKEHFTTTYNFNYMLDYISSITEDEYETYSKKVYDYLVSEYETYVYGIIDYSNKYDVTINKVNYSGYNLIAPTSLSECIIDTDDRIYTIYYVKKDLVPNTIEESNVSYYEYEKTYKLDLIYNNDRLSLILSTLENKDYIILAN